MIRATVITRKSQANVLGLYPVLQAAITYKTMESGRGEKDDEGLVACCPRAATVRFRQEAAEDTPLLLFHASCASLCWRVGWIKATSPTVLKKVDYELAEGWRLKKN